MGSVEGVARRRHPLREDRPILPRRPLLCCKSRLAQVLTDLSRMAPVRPERHSESSFATVRRWLIASLVRRLPVVTWQDYEADLERKLADLHDRVHRGAYRPLPSRRRHKPSL